jgi:type IV secretory pathway VirD2 relaxase
MPRSRAEPFEGRPLLDIASYGRSGPGRRDQISRADMETILRTVRRAPEVMVKVLTRGATTSKAAVAHLAYLDRKGELEIETDDGEKLLGAKAGQAIVDGWDLDLEDGKTMESEGRQANHRKARLVHKLLFSMPPGTPAEKVLGAVRVFAREEFALRNRYAMVLHTDEPHPHVHVVVKAIGEDGERLNIRKPTLRRWRHEFARRMREQGIDANATERGARGKAGRSLPDGLYRAVARREGVRQATIDSTQSNGRVSRDIQRGWVAVATALGRAGEGQDAADLAGFSSGVNRQPAANATEKEEPLVSRGDG